MFTVLVFIHVKPNKLEEFKQVSIYNASNSIKEPGIARFDVIQQQDDPTRFVLVEVYRDDDAPARHRQTEHYERWRSAVEEMLVEERSRMVYDNLFPVEPAA